MKCSEIMHRPVRWVGELDTVEVAARILRDENIGFLPVCDASGRFVGTLTDRDIALRVVAEGRGGGTQVGAVMTRETVTCRPEDELVRAEGLMEKEHKQRIVCTDDGQHILGVISITDVAQRDADWRVGQTMQRLTKRETRGGAF
jgi:CBS domain-containing protein